MLDPSERWPICRHSVALISNANDFTEPSAIAAPTDVGCPDPKFEAPLPVSLRVQVAMCDASTRFVADTIDAGNPTVGQTQTGNTSFGSSPQHYRGKSIRGVWGAMGTKDAGDTVE